MRKGEAALVVILIILSLASCAAAHAPQIPGANEGIQNAVHIDDPLKSWALYGTFPNAGSVAYYEFSLEKGDRLWFSVFTPEIGAAYPEAVLIGPGIENTGELPAGVVVLEKNGYMVIPGTKPDHPEYEPFTPASNYQWLKYEYIAGVPGTYYIALVNNGTGPGSYGLAVGYKEEFTLPEWVMIPISIANIRIWEGNSQAFVVGFPLFVILFGMVYLFRFKKVPVPLHPETLAGSAGGLLYIAGSVFMLIQALMALYKTGFEASFGVTAVFILIPFMLGVLILRYMVKPVKHQAIKLLVLGAVGLVVWAGYVIGPILVMLSGVVILFEKKDRAKQP